ncbi:universal stress protein [Natronococcus occultus]|uniref:Universal stress protein UspA-like protein n=1 Tax=Natronococcus occultus SP4 TaxID=694430 RepID=L0K3E4_9EURY|nr:universal stress protein [Natronococcus occultus]AGB38859.1 universal stress protein UspA-like protein [Natronococcus occultus SP4]
MVIVAAVDKSDRAAVVAEESEKLAEKFSDTIHVVHAAKRSTVIDSAFSDDSDVDPSDRPDSRLREEAKKPAEEVANSISVQHEVIGLVGEPAQKIVEYADKKDARYIVVSPRKQSRTGKVLFGSTAQSILLNSTCPVVSSIKPRY